MRLLSLFILFICVISLSARDTLRTKYVYEFGFDRGVVAFAQSGRIGLFEKSVTVPVVVPICSRLTYVRVEVDDFISQPKVKFNYHLSSVVISFNTWQYSVSSYVVIAKAVPRDDYCDVRAPYSKGPIMYSPNLQLTPNSNLN